MKMKIFLTVLSLVVLVSTVIFFLPFSDSSVVSEKIKYKGFVCAEVKRGNSSEWELVGCNHNLITNTGKDMVMAMLVYGGQSNVTYIAVANNTVPQSASDTSLQGEWTTCGLERQPANEVTINDIGNWSIAYTWTVTCDNVIVNATGLYNSTGGLFAETTLPQTYLYNTDQLKVTWTLIVS